MEKGPTGGAFCLGQWEGPLGALTCKQCSRSVTDDKLLPINIVCGCCAQLGIRLLTSSLMERECEHQGSSGRGRHHTNSHSVDYMVVGVACAKRYMLLQTILNPLPHIWRKFSLNRGNTSGGTN
uniref:Uncharacterized protein n=1 Tax=Eutreptiella gymnastica TaxID=73025 RepID=A0A7S4G7H2_9EUGL